MIMNVNLIVAFDNFRKIIFSHFQMLYPIRTEICPKLEYILEETMIYIEKYYPDFKSLMNKNLDILLLRRALASFYKVN